ncbi:MAG: nucleotidyltransferase domain-containing protein [Syntrophaceae bacterium]|nr:nucleotidyltransferase domain-containing protein [Syntrophaceae bacterium]
MSGWIYLNENEKKAVEALKSRLKERFELRDMRLFGSKARGHASPESDVDIMIELPKRSPEIESEIDDITFEVNLRNDSFITTIVFGQDELQQGPMKESPIYKIIRKEGIPI